MAADASTAAMCTYLIEARKYGAPTPDLPVSRGGSAGPYEYPNLKQIPLGQSWNGFVRHSYVQLPGAYEAYEYQVSIECA